MSSIFFTSADPDYRIKGSRDPLGLQPVWQATGRLVIPYLSMVSSYLKDFQTLALAWQCKQRFNIDDAAFPDFFLRWEQLMAYVRKSKDNGQSEPILGIERVRKHWEKSNLPVSSERVVLLENQRYTGVWGRYNSPFLKMQVPQSNQFSDIFSLKIERVKEEKALKNCLGKSSFQVSKEELESFVTLFDLPPDEKTFWKNHLLSDSCEGLWRQRVTEDWDVIQDVDFYTFIATLQAGSNDTLSARLLEIINTEQVLCPLNRIFRYLQSRSYWREKELENDEFIGKCKEVSNNVLPKYFTQHREEKMLLYSILRTGDNWETVKGIELGNKEVSERRGGPAWIAVVDGGLEVYHREGANDFTDYDPAQQNDNDYFTGTYKRLFAALTYQN